MADIFTLYATINTVAILVEQEAKYAGTVTMCWNEARPMTMAEADTALAFHGLARIEAWELCKDGLSAKVRMVDNRFNGTVAARIWGHVGTTHEEWVAMPAHKVEDGDLISDLEITEAYVVAGSRREGSVMRVHMVSEGKTWEDRHTTNFPADQFVMVARRKP